MARRTKKGRAGGDQIRLAVSIVLKPPISVEDLMTNTECDPEGADEFVSLIRALRGAGARTVAL